MPRAWVPGGRSCVLNVPPERGGGKGVSVWNRKSFAQLVRLQQPLRKINVPAQTT